jgi:hypothetical protein
VVILGSLALGHFFCGAKKSFFSPRNLFAVTVDPAETIIHDLPVTFC